MVLIRYPGSKEKLADAIRAEFPDEVRYSLWSDAAQWEYREPFFGAGAVGFRILADLSVKAPVWLNDIDRGMACLWRSVLKRPKPLCDLILAFDPTAEAFYEFKKTDGDDSIPELQAGFRKLALHQMSVSGFGAMSGGPLGGRDQSNARYPVDCRWNPERLRAHVVRCHRILKQFRNIEISCGDFATVIESAGRKCCLYLDPPYVAKGSQLYKHSMAAACHGRLADVLNETSAHWVLSYDDHPLVRRLYSECRITPLAVTYTNAVCKEFKRPKNGEIVITKE